MHDFRIASVASDGRLELTGRRHQIHWLLKEGGGSVGCVVEIVRAGHLYVTSLRLWSGGQDLSKDAGLEALASLVGDALKEGEIPRFLSAEAVRKVGRGSSVYRVKLPDAALWALWQGHGAPERQTASRCVLVGPLDNGVHVWGQLDPEALASGDLRSAANESSPD